MIRRAFAFALVAVAGLASTLTLAQTKPAATHHPPAAHHPKPKTTADAGAGIQTEAAPVASRADTDSHVDAGAVLSRTLDGGTRVFRFGEVEIEGRLRNPQLVYFLRRVRAEFAAGDLGHRSFMRELSDTRHDPSF
jgi:hypothetical protein